MNSGINIVDAVHSETSEDYLLDVANGINKIIPEAKCSVGKDYQRRSLMYDIYMINPSIQIRKWTRIKKTWRIMLFSILQ